MSTGQRRMRWDELMGKRKAPPWRIEENFARLRQGSIPPKCLLTGWVPERDAPDSKDLSIYLSTLDA